MVVLEPLFEMYFFGGFETPIGNVFKDSSAALIRTILSELWTDVSVQPVFVSTEYTEVR